MTGMLCQPMDIPMNKHIRECRFRLNVKALNYKETPEGYYDFFNIPIARSGLFSYKVRELEKDGIYDTFPNLSPSDDVKIYRPKETFTPELLKSIEGLPLTLEHPNSVVVKPDETHLIKGTFFGNVTLAPHPEDKSEQYVFVERVRFYAQDAIDALFSGKVELSIGYIYESPVDFIKDKDYIANEFIKFINHIALVQYGRAGSHCRINEDKSEVNVDKIEEKISGLTGQVDKLSARLDSLNGLEDTVNKIGEQTDNTHDMLAVIAERLNEKEDKKNEDSKSKKKEDDEEEYSEGEDSKDKSDDEKKGKARKNDIFMTPIDFYSLVDKIPYDDLAGWVGSKEFSPRDEMGYAGDLRKYMERRNNLERQYNKSRNNSTQSAEFTRRVVELY